MAWQSTTTIGRMHVHSKAVVFSVILWLSYASQSYRSVLGVLCICRRQAFSLLPLPLRIKQENEGHGLSLKGMTARNLTSGRRYHN